MLNIIYHGQQQPTQTVGLNGILLTVQLEFSCEACFWSELKTKINPDLLFFFFCFFRINIHTKCPNGKIASFSSYYNFF